ncbi:MAG: hypothetical protein E6J17_06670 [Chloroflexi bacterium]|nr:MAG: hypothetical protein E6J17_06670 [Chloroflexota bacterium]
MLDRGVVRVLSVVRLGVAAGAAAFVGQAGAAFGGHAGSRSGDDAGVGVGLGAGALAAAGSDALIGAVMGRRVAGAMAAGSDCDGRRGGFGAATDAA